MSQTDTGTLLDTFAPPVSVEIKRQKPLLGTQAVAELFAVNPHTIPRWRKMGLLPEPTWIGPRGRPHWNPQVIQDVLDGKWKPKAKAAK